MFFRRWRKKSSRKYFLSSIETVLITKFAIKNENIINSPPLSPLSPALVFYPTLSLYLGALTGLGRDGNEITGKRPQELVLLLTSSSYRHSSRPLSLWKVPRVYFYFHCRPERRGSIKDRVSQQRHNAMRGNANAPSRWHFVINQSSQPVRAQWERATLGLIVPLICVQGKEEEEAEQ